MHHGKPFRTYKIMQMIFSLHDMRDEAAMWKLHTRTKEISVSQARLFCHPASVSQARLSRVLSSLDSSSKKTNSALLSLALFLSFSQNSFWQQFHRVEHCWKYSSRNQLRSGWHMKTSSHHIQRLLTVYLCNITEVLAFLLRAFL